MCITKDMECVLLSKGRLEDANDGDGEQGTEDRQCNYYDNVVIPTKMADDKWNLENRIYRKRKR